MTFDFKNLEMLTRNHTRIHFRKNIISKFDEFHILKQRDFKFILSDDKLFYRVFYLSNFFRFKLIKSLNFKS